MDAYGVITVHEVKVILINGFNIGRTNRMSMEDASTIDNPALRLPVVRLERR